eukprot:403351781
MNANPNMNQGYNSQQQRMSQQYLDEEEEFEEELEEDFEDDNDGRMSQATRTKRSHRPVAGINRGKTNATMKTINNEGHSIMDNSQTTFQGTVQMNNDKSQNQRNNYPANQQQLYENTQNIQSSQQRKLQQNQAQQQRDKAEEQKLRTRSYYNLDEEGGEEYYDEEMEEDIGTQKDNQSRLSDSMMRTPDIQSMVSTQNGMKPNVYNNKLKDQSYYNKIYNKANKPKPQSNDDYFRKLKQRKTGIPMKVALPGTYKEVIPSFLPNDNKYKKFMQNINRDEEDIYQRLQGRVKSDDPYNIKRKKQPMTNYTDPFDQHIQKMEDNTLHPRSDPANNSLYKVHNLDGLAQKTGNRGAGFLSVQRNRDPTKLNSGLDQHNLSLPQIKDQVTALEKKMEKELDKEAKLKKDAKRLIGHALGKQTPELDRTVKAWLKKDQNPYQERKNNFNISPMIDKQLRKANFNKIPGVQNNLVALKEKFKNDQQLDFNYMQIKLVYNISLLDQHFGTPEAYLLKKKDDAKKTIQHVFKRKFEEKLIFQELNDPKTLRKDKMRLEEKLRMINIAVELAKQRLEWLLYDTPFTIQQLEREVKDQKAGMPNENSNEQQKLKEIAQNFKMDRGLYDEMQMKAREARNILGIQMLEARALKNRTGCESISDFVLLFREFTHIERLKDLEVLLLDALLNKKKAQGFYDFLKKIVEFEDETVKVKNEFQDQNIESKKIENDQFYNYDEIALEKAKIQDKEQFASQFKQEKIIFQFIPYWNVPINLDGDKLSSDLRNMLKFDILHAKVISAFLTCNTIEEMITYARHNRRAKEFVVFEREEMQFLIREHKIPENLIRNFAQIMIIIQKEFMMVPQMLFRLAKPTKIQEINFSNFQAIHLTPDAILSIINCIELHQNHVKRIIFENCEMGNEKALLFKDLLANPNKPIIACNFQNNMLGDQGIDHIVQAIKLNPKGDMRIVKFSHNKLSIQAAIRLSHVLKKRPPELKPLNLQILKMSHNQIGNIGTETLASFIKKNGTLKYLDISFNNIGDRGLYAVADCLFENERLEVLNMLGNEFGEKSLGHLGNSLVENQRLKLIILKFGILNSDKQAFLNFINNGFMISKKLRYLYINTPHYNDPVSKSLNESYLPKVFFATESHDSKIDSDVLIDFMSQIVEYQLFEGGNTQRVYRYGEKLLREIIKQKYEINNIEILIYLFDNIFGPDYVLADNLSPFHLFAKHGQIEALSYCLKLGISPNFKTSIAQEEYPSATALHIASGYSQLDTCEHLLKYGVEVDNKDLNGNTALHYAAVQGALQLAQLLVSSSASCLVLNKKNMLPLHSCIFSDNLGCWRFILAETEKQKKLQFLGKQIERTIDVKTYHGFTPLMIALEEDADNIFQYLIDSEADLKAQDEEGNTILHRAILLKNQKKAKLVIKRGANIHIRSFAGETPIMMAVRYGLIEVIRSLVGAGSDLHEKNYRGDSLLHLAARTDQADVIGYLLDKGLSTQERNREGQKPSDLAVRPGIKEMLSHNNLRHNLYTDANLEYKNGVRLNRNHAPSVASDDEDDLLKNKQKLNPNQKAKLLNEELIKYKVDHKDVFGDTYDRKYAGYDAAKLTQNHLKYDKDETRDKIKVMDDQAGQDDEEYGEELDEGDEDYEDDDDEDELQNNQRGTKKQQIKSQNKSGQNNTKGKSLNNGPNITYKTQNQPKSRKTNANQSAGFRGTVDVPLNDTKYQADQQAKIQKALGNNKQANQIKALTTNNKFKDTKRTNQWEGDNDEGDGEYDDEDGEEYDNDDDARGTNTQYQQTKNRGQR